MAENLNYNATGSKCYSNKEANCTKYGRLYNWSTAMSACPNGWHIPSDAEWTALTNYVGSNAATKLKATSGWNNNKNGTDIYGFSALPGGSGFSGGGFVNVGDSGNWWSATTDGANFAYRWYMYMGNEEVYSGSQGKIDLESVRCVKD